MANQPLRVGISIGNVKSSLVILNRNITDEGREIVCALTIPSVVRFTKDNNCLPLNHHPEQPPFPLASPDFDGVCIFEAKSLIGKKIGEFETFTYEKGWKYDLASEPSGDSRIRTLRYPSEVVTTIPYNVYNLIITELIRNARKKLKRRNIQEEIRDVVLTVPLSFDDAAIAAVTESAQAAGIAVLDVIPEPLACLFGEGYMPVLSSSYIFVVVDYAGRGLRASVIKYQGLLVDILAHTDIPAELATKQHWNLVQVFSAANGHDQQYHSEQSLKKGYYAWFGWIWFSAGNVASLLKSLENGTFVPTMNEIFLLYLEVLNQKCQGCRKMQTIIFQTMSAVIDQVIISAKLDANEELNLVLHGGIAQLGFDSDELKAYVKSHPPFFKHKITCVLQTHTWTEGFKSIPYGAAKYAYYKDKLPRFKLSCRSANNESSVKAPNKVSVTKPKPFPALQPTALPPLARDTATDHEALVEFLLLRGSYNLWLEMLGHQNSTSDQIWATLMNPQSNSLLRTTPFQYIDTLCSAASAKRPVDIIDFLVQLIDIPFIEADKRIIKDRLLYALFNVKGSGRKNETLPVLQKIMATCKEYNHADVMSYLFQHELVKEASDFVAELCEREGSTKESIFDILFPKNQEDSKNSDSKTQLQRMIGDGFMRVAKHTEAMRAYTDAACAVQYKILLETIRAKDFNDWEAAEAYLRMVKQTINDGKVSAALTIIFVKLGREEEVDKLIQAQEDERLCLICQDSPKDMILIPCGHICICQVEDPSKEREQATVHRDGMHGRTEDYTKNIKKVLTLRSALTTEPR
ncbi:hypothetical protein BV898_11722 [Hypsibius exemplaris]|uniref:Uncharacterized protein n=1 Tax=Hypsibius exemplaris TaxID=2072580 RepID=A0A1W0WFU8_HYPEX|nr:hypothetical protein BV898_11722 [Hypsibius exemplaris]